MNGDVEGVTLSREVPGDGEKGASARSSHFARFGRRGSSVEIWRMSLRFGGCVYLHNTFHILLDDDFSVRLSKYAFHVRFHTLLEML